MRSEAASLFHLRDGKVTRLVLYVDRERGLAELGLAPKAGERDSLVLATIDNEQSGTRPTRRRSARRCF
jgi:hypothetical protein